MPICMEDIWPPSGTYQPTHGIGRTGQRMADEYQSLNYFIQGSGDKPNSQRRVDGEGNHTGRYRPKPVAWLGSLSGTIWYVFNRDNMTPRVALFTFKSAVYTEGRSHLDMEQFATSFPELCAHIAGKEYRAGPGSLPIPRGATRFIAVWEDKLVFSPSTCRYVMGECTLLGQNDSSIIPVHERQ